MKTDNIGGGSVKKVLCFMLALLLCFCTGCTTTIITTIEEYENFFGGSDKNNKSKESENILDSVTIINEPSLPVATLRPRSSTVCFDALDKKQQKIYKTISAAAHNALNYIVHRETLQSIPPPA